MLNYYEIIDDFLFSPRKILFQIDQRIYGERIQ